MGSDVASVNMAALAAVGIVGLLGPLSATAQVQPPGDFRKTARVHIGPLYMAPAIDLKEFGIDSNVFNANDQPESDFVITVTPRAAVWMPVGQRLIWQVKTSGDFVYFATHASERSINPSIGSRATLLSKRFTFFGEGSYENTRQRPNFEIDARSRRTEESAGAGLGANVTPRLELEVAGDVSRIRHDADAVFRGTRLSETLNEDRTSASLTSRYRLSPLTTFVVEGEAIRDRFILSPIRDGDSTRIGSGVILRPRALISGSARIGVGRFSALNSAVPDYQGLFAAADLTYHLPSLTEFRFTAERDLRFSFEPTYPYYISNGIGLSGRQGLVSRFDVEGSWKRYLYRYRDFNNGVSSDRSDVTHNIGGGMGYTIRRGLRGSFVISYWNRRSTTNVSAAYHGVRILTSLSSSL